MVDQAKYERALRRVRQLREFYRHVAAYVVINSFLAIINLVTHPGHLWFFWPMLGWGIGLAGHALTVFGGGRFWGAEWEERKLKELMGKESV